MYRKSYLTLILFILALALLLIACKPLEKEVIRGTGNTVKDPGDQDSQGETCGDTSCGANQVCRDDACYCEEGYRTCLNSCIPEQGCCFDAECRSGGCQDNVCQGEEEEEPTYTEPDIDIPEEVRDCRLLDCRSNEICLSTGLCGCPEGQFWCDFQEKCIPDANCCDDGDCGGNDDCQPSGEAINVCMEFEEEELCKRVQDDESRFFAFSEDSFAVDVLKIVEGGNVAYFEIDGKRYEPFRRFTAYTLNSGPRVIYDEYLKFGGRCE